MTRWLETNEKAAPTLVGKRWQVRDFDELPPFQLARAIRELGLTPSEVADAADGEESPSTLLVLLLQVYATRYLAGDRVRSVEDATKDLPLDSWDIVDDDPQEQVDPTAGQDAQEPQPPDDSSSQT